MIYTIKPLEWVGDQLAEYNGFGLGEVAEPEAK